MALPWLPGKVKAIPYFCWVNPRVFFQQHFKIITQGGHLSRPLSPFPWRTGQTKSAIGALKLKKKKITESFFFKLKLYMEGKAKTKQHPGPGCMIKAEPLVKCQSSMNQSLKNHWIGSSLNLFQLKYVTFVILISKSLNPPRRHCLGTNRWVDFIHGVRAEGWIMTPSSLQQNPVSPALLSPLNVLVCSVASVMSDSLWLGGL